MKFRDTPVVGKQFMLSVVQKIYTAHEVSTVLTEACEEAIHDFKANLPVNPDYLNIVIEEVHENIENAHAYIDQLEQNYPRLIQAVHTERATTILLKHKKHALKELYEQSYVDHGEYNALRYEIDVSLSKYKNNQVKLEEIKFSEVITQCPLFSALSSSEMVNLRLKTKEKTYEKGTIIVERGRTINHATILISGSVREQYEDFYVTRGIGNIANAFDFTYGLPSKSTVRARNTIKVHELDRPFIQELLKNNLAFRKTWYKSLFVYCLKLSPGMDKIKADLSDREMRRFVEAAEVRILNVGDGAEVDVIGYLFEGEVQSSDNLSFAKGHYIPKGKKVKAETEAILLNFR